jgi:exonuclease SbcC
MKINKINCRNFFNHVDTALDFTEVGSPVLLTGSNGSGKSSSTSEALMYAIFGETRLSSIDDAIRMGQDEMLVIVDFELNGQNIRIARSKKRAKTQKLRLFIDDEDVSELLSETQKRINKLIPLSSNAFKSSVILRQEDSDWFLQQKPDERKKIIAEILDLGLYERLEKIAKEQRAELKVSLKTEQNILDGFPEENLVELREHFIKLENYLGKFENKINSAQSILDKINEKNALINQEKLNYEQILNKNQQIENSLKRHENEIASKQEELKVLENLKAPRHPEPISKEISELEVVETDLTEVTKTILKNYQEIIQNTIREFRTKFLDPVQENYSVISSELAKKNSDLNKSSHNNYICESCNRPFDNAEEIKQHHKNLAAEIEKLTSENAIIKNKYSELKIKLESLEKGEFEKAQLVKDEFNQKNQQLEETKNQLKKLRFNYEKALEEKRTYDIASSRIGSIKEAIASLVQSKIELNAQIQIIDAKTFQFEDTSEAKQKLSMLRESEKEALKLKSELGQRIKDAATASERRLTIVDSINRSAKRIGMLDKLCVAFSRKGIPASIIETVLPEIEEFANIYLSKMIDKSFEIKFRTTEISKSGETKDTLEIDVFDGTDWRGFESFSGGERFRVSLAVRLALSRVLSNKAGIELDSLVLDEPGIHLDPDGRELLVSTVKSLSSFFSRIIIMSHLDLVNEFSERIAIEEVRNDTERFI